jgi:hypothetical protein
MATHVWIGPNQSVEVDVVSDTELTAPYMGGGIPGEPEDVVVRTSKGSATATGAFTPLPRPPAGPTITAVTPDAGPGGTRVTIRGTGFLD